MTLTEDGYMYNKQRCSGRALQGRLVAITQTALCPRSWRKSGEPPIWVKPVMCQDMCLGPLAQQQVEP